MATKQQLSFQELNSYFINYRTNIGQDRFVNFDKAMTVLTEDDPKILELPKTNIQLYEHQKTVIYKCLELEKCATNGIETKQLLMDFDATTKKVTFSESNRDTNKLRTNFGIISGLAGQGKSYIALSIIALKPHMEPYNSFIGSQVDNLFYNREYFFNDRFVHLKVNLLLVTHSTVDQWISYIKQFPTIRSIIIKDNRDIEKYVGTNDLRKKFWDDLVKGNIDCLMISCNFYDIFFNRFLTYRHKAAVIQSVTKPSYISKKNYIQVPPTFKLAIQQNLANPPSSIVPNKQESKGYNGEDYTLGSDTNYIVDYLSKQLNKPEILEEYKSVLQYPLHTIQKYLCFTRIIVDETDSIKLTKNSPIFAGLFNWMISSSIGNLLFPNGNRNRISQSDYNGFEYQTSPYCNLMKKIMAMPHSKEIFLKADDNYVQSCIKLPPITYINIQCKSIAKAIGTMAKDSSMNGIIDMLLADDYDGISEHFNCAVKTPLEVMEAYKRDLGTQIDNKEKELTFVSSKTYSSQKAKEQSVEKVEKDLKSLKTRLESLIQNILSIDNDNSCAICYEAITKPVLFGCCGNIFCGQCIFETIKAGVKKCPYCNAPLEMDKITLMTEAPSKKGKKKDEPVDQIRPRLDECLHQIQTIIKDKNGKILVFSEHDGTFNKLSAKLKELKITYEQVQGSSAHIQLMIKRLTDGETKVLFLNSRNYGAGLNIPQATDIIIYHKMPDTLTMQGIGRANRIGRTCPLTVHQLLTTDEI